MRTFMKVIGFLGGIALVVIGAITLFATFNDGFSTQAVLGGIGLIISGLFLCGLVGYLFQTETLVKKLENMVYELKGDVTYLKRQNESKTQNKQ